MPTDAAGEHAPAPPAGPTSPIISAADGFVSAALPAAAITTETGHSITVTDHRRDLAGDSGLLWSNTVIVAPTGR